MALGSDLHYDLQNDVFLKCDDQKFRSHDCLLNQGNKYKLHDFITISNNDSFLSNAIIIVYSVLFNTTDWLYCTGRWKYRNDLVCSAVHPSYILRFPHISCQSSHCIYCIHGPYMVTASNYGTHQVMQAWVTFPSHVPSLDLPASTICRPLIC